LQRRLVTWERLTPQVEAMSGPRNKNERRGPRAMLVVFRVQGAHSRAKPAARSRIVKKEYLREADIAHVPAMSELGLRDTKWK
jgi:hypothetical protein